MMSGWLRKFINNLIGVITAITYEQSISIAKQFANNVRNLLKDKLLAVFAIRSLGSDYYRPGQSDIDTIIIASLKREELKNYRNDIRKLADSYQEKYNIPKGFGAILLAEEQLYPPYIVEEGSLKVARIVVNYFIDEKDNKQVLGINPILVNPKLINKGYGKRIIKYLIDIKGRIFDMLPDKMYAGIDITNIRCKHLFEKLVGQTDDNDFLYYELEF